MSLISLCHNYNDRLLQKLRDRVIVPKPVDFPLGLFHKERVDLANLAEGFLKNEYLVKVRASDTDAFEISHCQQTYDAIFISPSSATDDDAGPTNKGNAARHDITEVSIDSIVYCCHLVSPSSSTAHPLLRKS